MLHTVSSKDSPTKLQRNATNYQWHCHVLYNTRPGSKPLSRKFTNIMLWIVYYAYHGIKQNSNRKDAILRNFPYLGIAGVGFGSAIFHATLKNHTQWCKYSFLVQQKFLTQSRWRSFHAGSDRFRSSSSLYIRQNTLRHRNLRCHCSSTYECLHILALLDGWNSHARMAVWYELSISQSSTKTSILPEGMLI